MTQCHNYSSDRITNTDGFKPPKCHQEQVDQHNAIKNTKQILKSDWPENLFISVDYSAHCVCVIMLTNF